uniref:AB hydrolase-1 domain-containing protein n=1 Tax=Mucochytrium quahogii TaxID=96639 RepID=A0A7S2RM18_9STRA|mmetsp:Transcript_24198/g.39228  ORF Transcript_24198/g.39228 Transcript_24198/m.39228 type:complete len:487 (+) Transcript_24198:195-1655(+)
MNVNGPMGGHVPPGMHVVGTFGSSGACSSTDYIELDDNYEEEDPPGGNMCVTGSNCVFDGSHELGAKVSPNSERVIDVCGDRRLTAMSSATIRTRRRRSAQLNTLLGTHRPGCCHLFKRCLTWKWLCPVIIISISTMLFLLGLACLLQNIDWFDACPAVFIPTGLALPLVSLIMLIIANQPSSHTLQQAEFFSDALLEEMLSGENILDVYTVASRDCSPRESRHVIVFLSGIGGVPGTWKRYMDAVVDAGFTAITIQLPGSGALSSVRFSFTRTEKVVRRVLEQEFFGDSGEVSDSTQTSQTVSRRKVVLVGWGLSAHVCMYLASSKRLGNKHLAGLAILGSPALPTESTSWLARMSYRGLRLSWIAEANRLSEYASFTSEARRTIHLKSLNPEAKADWGDCFQLRKEALKVACSEYTGPVLCMSGSKTYLENFADLWGSQQDTPGSNVESIYVRGMNNAGLRAFPNSHNKYYARHLIEFASAATI